MAAGGAPENEGEVAQFAHERNVSLSGSSPLKERLRCLAAPNKAASVKAAGRHTHRRSTHTDVGGAVAAAAVAAATFYRMGP